jgi:glycyl-tRNA synthetase beta chain
LRRAAQGAVRVVLDFWPAEAAEQRPDLRRLVEAAVAGYGANTIVGSLESFLLDRLEYVLTSRGFPTGEVEAVLYTRDAYALADPYDCLVRLRALHRVREEAREDFEHLAVAFKRANNILGEEPAPPHVEPELFESDAERELHEAVNRLAKSDGHGHEGRLRELAGLRGPMDRFFDDVLVMSPDPKLRSNRLGLLTQAVSLFYRIADVSKLGG